MPAIFPFTAIVGQDRMRRALVLNAVDPRIGGVLIRGERGTAKSTAARALAELLPSITVVSDCRFACDPENPARLCDRCKNFPDLEKPLPTSVRPTPFINLPVSATEDRVVGTLDIEKAIQKGERHFEPGVLAAANRGLLYIDEVNLLDDHVVDVLLDAAAMGVNIVEREGISFSHPARFILVGTMNPEEGDLRPQLLDRFALSVDIHGILEARDRVTIVERNLDFEKDHEAFRKEWEANEQELSEKIVNARQIVEKVKYSSRDILTIASLTASLGVDGHRPDLVILKTARAQAALEGRLKVNELDIALAAELALPHRLKRGPFQQTEMSMEQLQERIEQLQGEKEQQGEMQTGSDEVEQDNAAEKKKVDEENSQESELAEQPGRVEPSRQNIFDDGNKRWWDEDRKVRVGESFAPRRLDTPLDRIMRRHAGRRSRTHTERKRGRYIQSRPANGKFNDLAFDATLRTAAPHQKARHEQGEEMAFAIRSSDLMKKIRVRRAANLVLFLVDASWSMAVTERMSATKGAILSLLTDAYQRRDRVGLITFQKDRALLVLSPTNSVYLAQKALSDIPVGGKTPLSAGLLMAFEVLKREKYLHPDVLPLLVIMTDGAGNVSMGYSSPQEESNQIAEMIAGENIHSVVINMEHQAFDQGLAQVLADHLDAQCLSLEEVRAENLYHAVKNEMQQVKSTVNIVDAK